MEVSFYGLNEEPFKKPGNAHAENKPRNMFVYLAMELCGFESKNIAEILQTSDANAIRQIKIRMKKRFQIDTSLVNELELLKKTSGFNI